MQGEQFLKAAYAYLYIRDFERAKEAFERAISCDPGNASYYFHASVTAMRSDEFELALTFATRAIELEPENSLYIQHFHIVQAAILTADGRQAYVSGNVELAKEKFTAAILLDPLNEDAQIALGMLEKSGHAKITNQEEDTG